MTEDHLFPLSAQLFTLCAPHRTGPPSHDLTSDNMSRSMAPSRTLLRSFQELAVPAQPSRRFLSSAQSSSAKRPAAQSASRHHHQRHQPLVQKRFKYKSVEEAKSRYSVGVRKEEENPFLRGTRKLTCGFVRRSSPFPGKLR